MFDLPDQFQVNGPSGGAGAVNIGDNNNNKYKKIVSINIGSENNYSEDNVVITSKKIDYNTSLIDLRKDLEPIISDSYCFCIPCGHVINQEDEGEFNVGDCVYRYKNNYSDIRIFLLKQ